MSRWDTVFFFIVAAFLIWWIWFPGPEPEPVQQPWTDRERLCADLMASTDHGMQYTPRERLRMCRVYIQTNGGFESEYE